MLDDERVRADDAGFRPSVTRQRPRGGDRDGRRRRQRLLDHTRRSDAHRRARLGFGHVRELGEQPRRHRHEKTPDAGNHRLDDGGMGKGAANSAGCRLRALFEGVGERRAGNPDNNAVADEHELNQGMKYELQEHVRCSAGTSSDVANRSGKNR